MLLVRRYISYLGIDRMVIETKKVSFNVEAEASGYLHILVEKGEKVVMGDTVVGLITETKEELEALEKEPWR